MTAFLALRRTETGPKKIRGTAEPPSGQARFTLAGETVLQAVGGLVHLDRELPPGGAEAYRNARGAGHRAIGMWIDPHRRQPWARVVTAAGGGDTARYEVCGAGGEPVGTVERERSLRGGHARCRWTVRQADGRVATGYKGRWFWWCVWWLFSPLWLAIAVGSVVGGGDVARMPLRIGFRSGGERVLDYDGAGRRLAVQRAEGWDPRLLAALTALAASHEGFLGDAWDAAG